MPEQVSEAIVLRTYPLKEADLIVSFYTRDQGKLRGVANRARKPKSGFGSSLERLSQVRVHYTAKENRELVRINNCDLIRSQFELARDYSTGVALDVMAEISEYLLPPHEANDRFYRLLDSVLASLRASGPDSIWKALTYFQWWAVRLSGFLPDLPLNPAAEAQQSAVSTTAIGQIQEGDWSRQGTTELRRVLMRLIEGHIERRLLSAPILESIE
jgi:DNA repair protein RecO (recombination protein O)